MDGPLHPAHESDPTRVNNSAPTAASAAVLPLAEAASLKQSAKPSLSALPPHIYADARAILVSAAEDMAVTKNVILVPSQKAEVAAMAMQAVTSSLFFSSASAMSSGLGSA